MSYIGNEPTSVAFLTDTFSGNGSTTAFTLSAAPAGTSSILVAITGVVQDPSTYSVVGTTLTFSPAPPTGTGNISVRFLGIPASGVTTTAYRTVTEFTATAGQTTFSVPSYTPGFIDVYRNGVLLGSADYTASNGVSVVLVNACTAGDLVEVISFSVSSVLNAMPTTGGTFSGNVLFAGGNGIWNTSGNVGVGTTSPSSAIHVSRSSGEAVVQITNSGSGASWVHFAPTSGAAYLHNTANTPLIFTTNGTERGRFAAGGDFQFNSGYGSVATAYGCRAWVNFNGTGTVAIRASGNVSSITDNGTGDYTVNFATAMPDANYSVNGLGGLTGVTWGFVIPCGLSGSGTTNPNSTTQTRFRTVTPADASLDNLFCNVAIFR